MSTRSVTQMVPASAVTEGAGVRVRRSLGTPSLRHLDPFLMLDHFSSDQPGDYIAGFPDHPHRGFTTLTYMLDGHMLHQDSLGNQGDLRAGGAQWMKAASGVIHSEMPQQSAGLMRGFQLWVNLPAAEKMSAPAYRDVGAGEIPEFEDEAARIRLLAGPHAGHRGPIEDPHTGLEFLDVVLRPAGTLVHPTPADHQVFLYLFEGSLAGDGRPPGPHSLLVFSPGDEVRLTAGPEGARFILVGGRPLREPIVQYGPFVMNTRAEIEQALADYRDDRLVQRKAAEWGRPRD